MVLDQQHVDAADAAADVQHVLAVKVRLSHDRGDRLRAARREEALAPEKLELGDELVAVFVRPLAFGLRHAPAPSEIMVPTAPRSCQPEAAAPCVPLARHDPEGILPPP